MERIVDRTDGMHEGNSTDIAQQPHELWKLVRKLRWIGMEEEARRLQLRLRSTSPEHCTLLCETFSTD
jgi:hypothetical protein